ncbi:hypothetical protein HYQ44_018934 [Verticillium longisporum]|nr:hypothetical protein HYQ44_018934 [Verticillium longisporum]
MARASVPTVSQAIANHPTAPINNELPTNNADAEGDIQSQSDSTLEDHPREASLMDVDTGGNPENPETVMLRRIQQLTEEPTMEGSTESHFMPVAELVKVLDGQSSPFL